MNEEGVSMKARDRIKKMMKLKILEKGQKLVKLREPATFWGQKSPSADGMYPKGSRTDSTGPKGKTPLPALWSLHVWSDNTNQTETQLPCLTRMFWKETLTRRAFLFTYRLGSFPIRRVDSASCSTVGTGRLPGP